MGVEKKGIFAPDSELTKIQSALSFRADLTAKFNCYKEIPFAATLHSPAIGKWSRRRIQVRLLDQETLR